MRPIAHDACFLISGRGTGRTPFGMTCMQVDDTLNAGNHEFIALEKRESAKFKCKPTVHLTEEKPLRFNGALTSTSRNVVSLTQNSHISRLSEINEKDADNAYYISQRARGAYVAAVCRPDLSFRVSLLAQVTDPTTRHVKLLNATIAYAISTNRLVCALFRLTVLRCILAFSSTRVLRPILTIHRS